MAQVLYMVGKLWQWGFPKSPGGTNNCADFCEGCGKVVWPIADSLAYLICHWNKMPGACTLYIQTQHKASKPENWND